MNRELFTRVAASANNRPPGTSHAFHVLPFTCSEYGRESCEAVMFRARGRLRGCDFYVYPAGCALGDYQGAHVQLFKVLNALKGASDAGCQTNRWSFPDAVLCGRRAVVVFHVRPGNHGSRITE